MNDTLRHRVERRLHYLKHDLWMLILTLIVKVLDVVVGPPEKIPPVDDEEIKRELRRLDSMQREYPLIFPPERVSEFENKWYSRDLDALDEIKLEDWARAENVSEVYRFTFLPSFHPPITYRIWRSQSAAFTHKSGKTIYGRTTGIDQTVTKHLRRGTWNKLLKLLEAEGFWTQPAWETKTNGLDGAELLLEGWKNGVYKVHICWSPKSEQSMGKVARFFDGLEPNIDLFLYIGVGNLLKQLAWRISPK